MDEEMIWAYRATFTQTDVAGGNVIIRISPNERMEILYGVIGPNNYGAGRAIEVVLSDESNYTIANLLDASIDNVRIPLSLRHGQTADDKDGNNFADRILLSASDKLTIAIYSLAQNEAITVAIRALVRLSAPSISTSDSGGTVTTSTDYNKVI